jgi:hypothetical protein
MKPYPVPFSASRVCIMRTLLIGITLAYLSFPVAQAGGLVQPGAKIFIAPMENGLDGFLAPEIIKKKVPLILVTDETMAEYILVGASLKGDDKWYHSVFGGKDKNEGNVRLLNVATKQLVWAGEAGDRSLWWGSLSRGGQRKVADRIVSQMRKGLFR